MKKDNSKYEILSTKCLSGKHTAFIEGIIKGLCECGNCKIMIRQHRKLSKTAWHEIPKYHDYCFDSEEVMAIKTKLLKNISTN